MQNPLLQNFNTKYNSAPFSEIKEEHYLPAFQELTKQSLAEIDEIVNNPEEPTFENVIDLTTEGAPGTIVAPVNAKFADKTLDIMTSALNSIKR